MKKNKQAYVNDYLLRNIFADGDYCSVSTGFNSNN